MFKVIRSSIMGLSRDNDGLHNPLIRPYCISLGGVGIGGGPLRFPLRSMGLVMKCRLSWGQKSHISHRDPLV